MKHPVFLKVIALLFVLALLNAVPAIADNRADDLIARYSAAHRSGDLKQLQKLVAWGQAEQRTREKLTQRLGKYLHLPIRKIEYRPAPADYEFQFYGATPSLEPVGWLSVTFTDPEDDLRYRGVSFIVGKQGDAYAITVAQ